MKRSIRVVGEFLIIHLKRFVQVEGNRKKVHSKVFCNPAKLEVPVFVDVCQALLSLTCNDSAFWNFG